MAYYPPGYGVGMGVGVNVGPIGVGVGVGVGRHPVATGAAIAAAERRFFYIMSERNGEVMDIRGDDPRPGAEVLTYPRKMGRSPNQMWFCDQTGVIRSALNDFALEARAFETFRMAPYTGQPDQQWIFSGNRIVNRMRPMECLTDRDGQRPCHAKEYKGKDRQHWRVEMIM